MPKESPKEKPRPHECGKKVFLHHFFADQFFFFRLDLFPNRAIENWITCVWVRSSFFPFFFFISPSFSQLFLPLLLSLFRLSFSFWKNLNRKWSIKSVAQGIKIHNINEKNMTLSFLQSWCFPIAFAGLLCVHNPLSQSRFSVSNSLFHRKTCIDCNYTFGGVVGRLPAAIFPPFPGPILILLFPFVHQTRKKVLSSLSFNDLFTPEVKEEPSSSENGCQRARYVRKKGG